MRTSASTNGRNISSPTPLQASPRKPHAYRTCIVSAPTIIPLAICLKDADTAIGVTAFHRVDLVSHAAVFSICISDPSQWSHGYGREVTRLMLHYAFDILNLHRVQLHVWADNAPGIRVYEQCGFVKEGTLRDAMRKDGRYFDFLVMGILEEEWKAMCERVAKAASKAST